MMIVTLSRRSEVENEQTQAEAEEKQKSSIQKRLGLVKAFKEEWNEQAGAELGQAKPELGFGEKDLSLKGYIWGWAWMARGLKYG